MTYKSSDHRPISGDFIVNIPVGFYTFHHFQSCVFFDEYWIKKVLRSHGVFLVIHLNISAFWLSSRLFVYLFLTPPCHRPDGTPTSLEKSAENLSPVRKIPWNFISIGKLHWTLSSPLGKALKFCESPLDFWAMKDRIQNPKTLKARYFPSPLAFGSLIFSPGNTCLPTTHPKDIFPYYGEVLKPSHSSLYESLLFWCSWR